MNKKLLWKIEELWEKYFVPKNPINIDVFRLYENKVSIYNPDFHTVNNFSFEKSDYFVHDDDNGKYYGLKNSQVTKIRNKLVYLFDNHNKILQPFLEYYEIVGKSFDVVHIDAHDDDAISQQKKPKKLELKNVQEYIKKTRISDFFDFLSEALIPAPSCVIPLKKGIQESPKNILDSRIRENDNKSNLIGKIHRYTKSNDFKKFKKPKKPYILSLDIDIFGSEGDFTDLESKILVIAEAWSGADVVCIAMSPGFVDQKFAKNIVEIFIK